MLSHHIKKYIKYLHHSKTMSLESNLKVFLLFVLRFASFHGFYDYYLYVGNSLNTYKSISDLRYLCNITSIITVSIFYHKKFVIYLKFTKLFIGNIPIINNFYFHKISQYLYHIRLS